MFLPIILNSIQRSSTCVMAGVTCKGLGLLLSRTSLDYPSGYNFDFIRLQLQSLPPHQYQMFRKKATSTQTGLIRLIKKVAVYGLLTTTGLLLYTRYYKSDLQFSFEATQSNISIIKGCQSLRRGVYCPSFHLPFGFLQYLYAKYLQRVIYIKTDDEKISNGRILSWAAIHQSANNTPNLSIVLVVGGCKGYDNAARYAVVSAVKKYFRVVLYSPSQYKQTQELEEVVKHIQQLYPTAKIYGMGLQYGANLLVRHAAKNNVYKAIVSIGNPLDLEKSQRNFRGWWKLTQRDMIEYRKKLRNLPNKINSLYQIDQYEHNISPERLPQFKQQISSINYLKKLPMKALFLNSYNDPFSLKDMTQDNRIQSQNCIFVQTKQGGHNQWFQTFRAKRWIYKPAVEFLQYIDDAK